MTIEWNAPIPIDSIPREGITKSITADQTTRDALALRYDLYTVQALSCDIHVKPKSDKMTYHVKGDIKGQLDQKSSVSGKPVPTDIHYDFEAWYQDQSRITSFQDAKKNKDESNQDEFEIENEKDSPEKLHNNIIDLGDIAAEFLGLALDDYPRTDSEKEGTGDYIEVNPEDAKPNPFAALASLKTKE